MGARKGKSGGEPANLYQRGGIYYARVQVGNREYRRSLKTPVRREAERRLKEWLKTISPYHGTSRGTFLQAAELWLTAGEWKPKTVAGYEKLFVILKERLGGLYWDQVDKAALMDLVAYLRQPDPPRRKKPAGTATINRYLTVISGIANHVRELPGWPEINPVTLLPKKPRRARDWHYIRPPASDIDAYFDRMKSAFGDLCRFGLLTGARMDEITRLKHSDVENDRAHLWDTKSGFRTISLSAEVLSIVKRQARSAEQPNIFLTRHGTPYKRVSEMWREVVNRAQNLAQQNGRTLTRMRFHDLRHEYAIRYLENGGSIYTLKELMGHGTIKQTERYLRYLTPEQAERAKFGSAQ